MIRHTTLGATGLKLITERPSRREARSALRGLEMLADLCSDKPKARTGKKPDEQSSGTISPPSPDMYDLVHN